MTKWKQIGTDNSKFYTYVDRTTNNPVVIGPGDRQPTPKEIVEALHSGLIDSGHNSFSGIGIKHDQTMEENSAEELPDGTYYYVPPGWSHPDGLVPVNVRGDSYIERDVYHTIYNDIQDFINAEDFYNEVKIQFRRGILMYGPPGEGKTTIIRQLAHDVLTDNTIIIFTKNTPTREFLEYIRTAEPERMKVFIFEELAAAVSSPYFSTEALLDFLDGETSPSRSIIIGTTNYPHMLPMNIVDRPSRFDLLIEVGPPEGTEISRIAEHYLQRKPKQLEIDALDGLSTAAIKEACILSIKSKKTIKKAAEELKARHDLAVAGFR